MSERIISSDDTGEVLQFRSDLGNVTIGLLAARAINPLARSLILQFNQQHPFIRDSFTRDASLVLAQYIPDSEDRAYVERTVYDSDSAIWKIIQEEANKGGPGMRHDMIREMVRLAQAGALRLVALGSFLRQNGVSQVEINLGNRTLLDLHRVNLQDIDTAIQIAANTVVAGVGQTRAVLGARVDHGEGDDFDAIGSWRDETLQEYR